MLRSIILYLVLSSTLFASDVFAQGVTTQNGVTATVGGGTSITVSWTNNCRVCSWQLSTKRSNGPWIIQKVLPKGVTQYTITDLPTNQQLLIKMEAKRANRWVARALLTATPIYPSAGDGIGSTVEQRVGLYYGTGKNNVTGGITPSGFQPTYTNPEANACSPGTVVTLNQQTGSPAGQKVCGVIETLANNQTLYFYKGIQYANSTAKANRWVDPKPPQWPTLSAYEYGPVCPQGKGSGIAANDVSEDCLYVNVWTPTITPSSKLPVMVFIHGGAFIEGSGGSDKGDMPGKLNLYDGTEFVNTALTDGDSPIVFVTLNYRLGVLGFLAGNTIGFNGNYGIKDQTAALEWVQRNISRFGGDPTKVMIFGESAGAQSVALHLTITANNHQGLFTNGVTESNYGIQYMPLASAQQKATSFLNKTGCSALPTEAFKRACLRGFPLMSILDDQKLGGYTVDNIKCSGLQALIPWSPVIDGTFIQYDPINTHTTKPFMNGSNLSESVPFLGLLPQSDLISGAAYNVMMDFLFKNSTPNAATIQANYKNQYPGLGAKARFEQVVTDYLWTCFNRKFSTAVPTDSNITPYRYHNIHHGSFSTWVDANSPTVATYTKPVPKACYDGGITGTAVCHADELPFVFGNATDALALQQTFTTDESNLSSALREYWIQFARNANPNSSGLTVWPLNNTGNILKIQAPSSSIQSVTDIGTGSLADQANCDTIWDRVGYDVTSKFMCQ